MIKKESAWRRARTYALVKMEVEELEAETFTRIARTQINTIRDEMLVSESRYEK